ncbi:MAG: hypothetical protein ACR2QV_11430 [Gammaproteobacteria bacterium]
MGKSRRLLVLTATFSMLLSAVPAAAEWRLEPYVAGGARFDSNPRYLSSRLDPESALGTIVDARLPLIYQSPRGKFSLRPRAVYSFYPDSDDEDLEDRDHFLLGDANRITRRSDTGVSFGYTDLSLRTSELQSAGDSSAGGSGTGRIFFKDKQDRWYVQPYWLFQFTPKNSITLNGGYEEVRYDEDFTSTRFDYDYTFATATLRRAVARRHTLALRLQFTQYDGLNKDLATENDSETNSASLVYEYDWSETARVTVDLGAARTKNTVSRPNALDPVTGPFCNPSLVFIFPCEVKNDSTNFVGNIEARKKSETVDYVVTVGQSITPNSNGAEVLRFSIDASAEKRFSGRLSGKIGIIAFTQNDVGDSSNAFDRDYIRGQVRLNYKFSRHWALYGSYAYTFDDQRLTLSSDRTARNHFASAGIVFSSDRWRW